MIYLTPSKSMTRPRGTAAPTAEGSAPDPNQDAPNFLGGSRSHKRAYLYVLIVVEYSLTTYQTRRPPPSPLPSPLPLP